MYTIYYKKIEKIKKLLWWIFTFIMATIIFCIAIILIPMQTHTAEKIELTYIFVDDAWNEYDLFNDKIHWSADDRAFLFEEDINTWDIKINNNTWYLTNKDYVQTNNNDNNNINTELNNDNLEEIINKELLDTDENDKNVLEDNNILKKEQKIINKTIPEIEYKDCVTPRNNTVKHGEYVLAYQQRSDVPTICNVQKRSCVDGILKWTYTQASCKEDVKYEYTRVKVISYNNNKPGELIQNPKYAKNDNAKFDNNGKIIEKNENNTANTIWNNSDNQPKTSEHKTNLTHKNYANCVSPWWDIVWHGQFIKAYKSALWFTNKKCQVELRLCLNWTLQWQASYKNCEYKDIPYEEYFHADDDNDTSPNIEAEQWETHWFFHWISTIFN